MLCVKLGSMFKRVGKHLTVGRLALGVAVVIIAGMAAVVVLDADPAPHGQEHGHGESVAVSASYLSLAPSSSSSCGTASTVLAAVDGTVARGIYEAELHSSAVSADVAHVTGSQALLSALAGNNQAAVYAAVHAIVYAPHWHIVRLRVVKAGRVVADVGGPDVIAPVSGPLRSKGRTVGTYVMSVQDDAGYVKLVSRFIGVPVDLYRNGSLVMGTLQLAPSKVSSGAAVSVGGSSYQDYVFDAQAFPSGPLRVSLLVPRPTGSLAAGSCSAVRLAAWGNIAMHIAARFKPLSAHYQALVDVLMGATGGPAYVRSGARRIAGGSGPLKIPLSGAVKYGGRSWEVFSWEPSPPARVYLLTPAA